MDWARILKQGGIPEPPGYLETVAKVKSRPKKEKKKPKAKKKG
jgi:hypothetical protein|tara:strand:- start:992 stop:1120 length:129 start_codon:yes stop_codon:yes gene_type:complete